MGKTLENMPLEDLRDLEGYVWELIEEHGEETTLDELRDLITNEREKR